MIIKTIYNELFEEVLMEDLIYDVDLSLTAEREKDTGAVNITEEESIIYIKEDWQELLGEFSKEILQLDDTQAVKDFLRDTVKFIELIENKEQLWTITEQENIQTELNYKVKEVV